MRHISIDGLKRLMDSGEKVGLLDVEDAEGCHREHIKGAVCLPMNRLEEAANYFEKNQPVVVYCCNHLCNSSLYVARKLKEMGFSEVYEFGGGLERWKKEGLPVEEHTAAPAPR